MTDTLCDVLGHEWFNTIRNTLFIEVDCRICGFMYRYVIYLDKWLYWTAERRGKALKGLLIERTDVPEVVRGIIEKEVESIGVSYGTR